MHSRIKPQYAQGIGQARTIAKWEARREGGHAGRLQLLRTQMRASEVASAWKSQWLCAKGVVVSGPTCLILMDQAAATQRRTALARRPPSRRLVPPRERAPASRSMVGVAAACSGVRPLSCGSATSPRPSISRKASLRSRTTASRAAGILARVADVYHGCTFRRPCRRRRATAAPARRPRRSTALAVHAAAAETARLPMLPRTARTACKTESMR